MKSQHKYAPAMGQTVREALDNHTRKAKFSQSTINSRLDALNEWEMFSGNPKIRNVSDEQMDDFETSLVSDGWATSSAYRAASVVRSVVRRARGGALHIEKQRTRPGEVETIPTRIDGTLRSYMHLCYFRERLRGKSEAQRRNHEIAMRHFRRSLGREPKLADLTNGNIADVMQFLTDRGRSNRTANKTRDCLCALWRHLCQEGKVKKWPRVEQFPEPIRAPIAWTKQELCRLWNACESEPGTVGNIPAGIWWLALHCVLWNSAERIGAVLQLRWMDVDLDTGDATFTAETRKGKRADNASKFNEITLALLRSFPSKEPEATVFSWGRCKGTLWNHYKRILKRAGLPCDRRSKFHRLRKSAATWFEIAGGNATDLLMHSSRQVTKSYLDPRLTGKQHAVDLLFQPEALVAGGAP